MAHLSLSLLGPLQATVDDHAVTGFKYDKVRALLAYLAVEGDHAHERAALVGLLWPDLPEDAARNNLRQTLLTLREAIGDRSAAPPFLLTSRTALQFNPVSDFWLDVKAFGEYLAACERHPHANPVTCRACASRRQAAVALYQGDFLAEFFLPDSDPFEEWALLKREWLHRQMINALAHLVAYHERRGQYADALQYADRQVALEPWREETHRQLMRLYVLNGERSAALAQYESCRHRLAQELAVDPEAATIALYEQIRSAGDRVPLAPTQLSLPALRRHNLPPAATPFVGRESELAALGRLLDEGDCRLLTLTGPGGVGKTRLALQVAAEQLDAFADGVFYLPLVALSDPALLATTLLRMLGVEVTPASDPRAALFTHLERQEMLLILDNFEHLLAGADLLADLLTSAAQVSVLVTSRERLNLQREWIFPVDGLPMPGESMPLAHLAENDAVHLFVQSAQRLCPDFTLSATNGAAVARICQLVGGIPLAIELAATWVRLLTAQEIATEIEQGLGFLTTTLRDLPTRHRSLAAVFAYSWQLLSTDEQRVLSQLAIFRGGFRREAAEQVAAASLPLLRSLVDKSLLRHHLSGRYEFHALIHQYVGEQLAANGLHATTQQNHTVYFLRVAEDAAQALKGAQQSHWLALLEQEVDNLRAVLQSAIDAPQPDIAARICRALEYFWDSNGRLREGKQWLEQTLPLLSADDPDQLSLRADLFNSLGNVVCEQGDYTQAAALYAEGLVLQRTLASPEGIAKALNNLGHIAYRQGDTARSLALFEESLALYRQCGDLWAMTRLLSNIGAVLSEQGDYARSERYQRESLALRRQREDSSGIATSLFNLAEVLHRQGNDAQALIYLEESLGIFRQLDLSIYLAMTLSALGTITVLTGKAAQALPYLTESLKIFRTVGAQYGVAAALEGMGGVAGLQGETERAARFLGAAEKLRETLDVPLLNVECEDYARLVHFAQSNSVPEEFASAWAEGRALPLAHVIDLALVTIS